MLNESMVKKFLEVEEINFKLKKKVFELLQEVGEIEVLIEKIAEENYMDNG